MVAGLAKGRRLVAPAGLSTRPTGDAVREAIFNALQSLVDFEGASVLDLYAGTGALGIEALSRGAARATLVERDAKAVASIRANLAACGFEDRAEVVAADVDRAVLPKVDVGFVDPPYTFVDWPALLTRVHAGWIVAESDRELGEGADLSGYRLVRARRYGITVVNLLCQGAET